MGKSIASRFENIDVARSLLLGVIINDDELTLEMDFFLLPAHPDYEAPGEGDAACFHPGMLRFAGITRLSLDRAEVKRGEGVQRRFAIQSFTMEGTRFALECDWGTIQLQARSIRVLTD